MQEGITIDLLNQIYGISGCSKVNHAGCCNPPLYSRANPFVVGNPGPCDSKAKGPHIEYSYIPKKHESNKPQIQRSLKHRGREA